ncbi:hypothetical protein PT974_09195 [Cladobotryum mycophilum]|uniref:Uncharacterized protein n=1 Tax=Cladobotryum mycophilum TaxID=491253 RepID=A0ABR0SGR2_9HYPO
MSQLGAAFRGRHASPGTSHDTTTTTTSSSTIDRGDAGPSLHQDDRRRAGRSIPQSQSFPTSPASSLSSRAPRSSRPIVPSPLSTPNNVAFPTSAKLSPPGLTITTGTKRENPIDPRSRGNITPSSTGGITFYTDSSNPSSPEEESPRTNLPVAPNEFRDVFQPVTSRPAEGSNKATIIAMAGSVTAAAQGDPTATVLARKSSIDSAISAVTSNMQSNGPSNGEQRSHDIAKLITTAGSAEAAIQHLLKEKQSQSQQNSQLWRLVDKQRAMILGLNKDLEAALKDKERYRKKLKEMMANPAVIKAAGGRDGEKQAGSLRDVTVLRPDVDSPKELSVALPDSPTLDAESQKASPIDMILAPYPITPPADRTHAPPSAVGGPLNPRPEEREPGKLDRAMDDKEANKAPAEKSNEKPSPISINVSLPPSLSLPSPSDPPKMPPPRLPDSHSPPIVNVVEPTPQPNEGLAKFPSPPRKGPPAPLQLKQEIRLHLRSASVDEDTDSDYDDLLDVTDFIPEKRGRRRTREEDDREREILALREAETRSVSKKSKSGKGESPVAEVFRNPRPYLQS